MNADDVAKLATVIADNANMGDRIDKMDNTLGQVVVAQAELSATVKESNKALLNQFVGFMKHDKEKKDGYDKSIKENNDDIKELKLEQAKLKTQFKYWLYSLTGGGGLIAGLIKLFP